MNASETITHGSNKRIRRFARLGFSHFVIILFGAVMIYPVLWMIMSSFKSGNAIFSDPSLFPKQWTFDNYVTGWSGVARTHFSVFFRNSIFLCLFVVIGNIVSCSMAAYSFSRLKFKLKNLWFGLMMMSIMLPAHAITIPRYLMFRDFGWVNSPQYLALIVPKFLATDAFFVFMLVQFMRGLPRDLDESANLDGCSRIGIFFRIIVPLSGPAMVTTALFSFLWTYDDFFNQLLYISDTPLRTVPLGLRMFLDGSGVSNWGSMLAMSVLSILPCFVLFFSLQKYFVQGIATTGMKG